MGHKIFVSYKYKDDDVYNLNYFENSTVRNYVDKFEEKLDNTNHIYKGEENDEDLSAYTDDTIWEKLKDRIYDSTLTVVFISPNMKVNNKKDRDQWIPWEISYSLKETSRKTENGDIRTSKTNAMIAVVLPDSNNSYAYYLEDRNCCSSFCKTHHTDKLFKILRENKFNLKNATKMDCSNISDEKIWVGDCSYIKAVRWNDFIDNIDFYINEAYDRLDNIENYNISKEV